MKYLDLPQKQQSYFLRTIKEKTSYSWSKIADILKVNRSMIFFYLNEHSKLPYNHYLKLCKLANVEMNCKIGLLEINREIVIRHPTLSTTLAEFLGALAGDGHVNNITFEVSISMDKDLDLYYSNHIVKMFTKLFGVKARKYTQNNKVKCFIYSKRLVFFLSKRFRVPIGKKKDKLHIPKGVLRKKVLTRAYIRGLFDTDGSFHRHYKNDSMIGIISTDRTFISEIRQALRGLGFVTSLNGKNLNIYRKKDIQRFFKEIKPSNKKHLTKYQYYVKNGRVPLTNQILNR